MTSEEMEATIVALQAKNAELEERVADLELRVARGHNCAIDLCAFDDDGDCRLAGADAGEIWGWGPTDSYPWGES